MIYVVTTLGNKQLVVGAPKNEIFYFISNISTVILDLIKVHLNCNLSCHGY